MSKLVAGINTCFAVKRWPRVADWAAIVRDELGLSTVQLSMDCLPIGPPAAPGALSTAAGVARTGIEVHSVFTGLGAYGSNLLLHPDREARDAAQEYYEGLITVAAAAGAQHAGGHVGAFSIADAAQPARVASLSRELIDRMGELAEFAAERGLRGMLFENLAVVREPGATAAEAKALERDLVGTAVPWRLCLDVGHPVAMSGPGDPDPLREWLDDDWLLPPVVQLQQAQPGADNHGGFGAPGRGGVDLGAVVSAVNEWRSSPDPLFLEVIPAHEADDASVLRELVESVEALRCEIEAVS